MSKLTRSDAALLILAAIGAGTLAGAVLGLALGRRAARPRQEEMVETVDDLRRKAEMILRELTENTSV